jgi:hypothetical protein
MKTPMKDSDRATQVLRGMVYALLESGVKKPDIVAAFRNLSAEAERDDWEKALAHRAKEKKTSP